MNTFTSLFFLHTRDGFLFCKETNDTLQPNKAHDTNAQDVCTTQDHKLLWKRKFKFHSVKFPVEQWTYVLHISGAWSSEQNIYFHNIYSLSPLPLSFDAI